VGYQSCQSTLSILKWCLPSKSCISPLQTSIFHGFHLEDQSSFLMELLQQLGLKTTSDLLGILGGGPPTSPNPILVSGEVGGSPSPPFWVNPWSALILSHKQFLCLRIFFKGRPCIHENGFTAEHFSNYPQCSKTGRGKNAQGL